MQEQLSSELDQALRLIASKKEISLRKPYIEQLVFGGYVIKSFFGSWRLTNKGKIYLREHPNNE